MSNTGYDKQMVENDKILSESTNPEGFTDYIDVVFDGPPGPEAGRFVEVEDSSGKSINAGKWIKRPDGFWALRIGF